MPEPHILDMKFHIHIVLYISVKSLHTVTYVQLGTHSFLFSNLFSGNVGIGVARSADMTDFGFSGVHFVECYVITVLCDVT